MIADILEFRREREWQRFHTPKDMALSLVLEVAEVIEHFQWKEAAEIQECIDTNRDTIGHELADVLYWVLLMSHDMGIDLSAAFRQKMDKNRAKYPVEKARGSHSKYSEL